MKKKWQKTCQNDISQKQISTSSAKMLHLSHLSEKNRRKQEKELALRRREGEEISELELTLIFNDGDNNAGQFTPEQR